jgi:NDP-sugar pyrophosphorylase family protein
MSASVLACLIIDVSGQINAFREKSDTDGSMINGGFMVMEPGVFDYIADDTTALERAPLEKLASDKQLFTIKDSGNAWIPSATSNILRICGQRARLRGRYGIDDVLLR